MLQSDWLNMNVLFNFFTYARRRRIGNSHVVWHQSQNSNQEPAFSLQILLLSLSLSRSPSLVMDLSDEDDLVPGMPPPLHSFSLAELPHSTPVKAFDIENSPQSLRTIITTNAVSPTPRLHPTTDVIVQVPTTPGTQTHHTAVQQSKYDNMNEQHPGSGFTRVDKRKDVNAPSWDALPVFEEVRDEMGVHVTTNISRNSATAMPNLV